MSEDDYQKHPDNCEACKGARGGVRGNENVIDGVILCDYCSVDYAETLTPEPHE